MNDESNSTSTTSGSERKMNSISGTSDTNDGSDTASTNTGFTTTGGNYRDVNFSDGMRDTMDDSDTATVNSSSTSSGENGQESQSIASYGADTNTPLAPTPRLITQTASTLTLTGHRKSPRYFQDTASSASPPSQSIRENARNRSESTGRQTSANSYYNVAYARSRRSHHSHEDQQVAGPLTQLNYLEMRPEQGARSPQGQPGFPEPQASETEEEDQPGDDLNDGQPTHQDDSRVCFCDNLPMPLDAQSAIQLPTYPFPVQSTIWCFAPGAMPLFTQSALQTTSSQQSMIFRCIPACHVLPPQMGPTYLTKISTPIRGTVSGTTGWDYLILKKCHRGGQSIIGGQH
jgi:hypothetical protein